MGNLPAKNEQSFTWSQDNRLLRVKNNTQTLGEYGYDARGLRTIRTTAEQTVMTLCDQGGNMLVETDGQGNTLRECAYLDGRRISLFDYTMNPEVYVEVYTSSGVKLSEVPVYAFDNQNHYTSLYTDTDENGIAIFKRADFGPGSYSFRVDYLSGQFWSTSEIVKRADTNTVVIEEEAVELTVTLAGQPIAGQKVYLCDSAGNYLGGYNEIQASPKRYPIINRNNLFELFGILDENQFQQAHRNWVEPELKNHSAKGNGFWSESVAVGTESFVKENHHHYLDIAISTQTHCR